MATTALILENFVGELELCDVEAVAHDCPSKWLVIFYKKKMTYDMVKRENNYHIDAVTDLNGVACLENECG